MDGPIQYIVKYGDGNFNVEQFVNNIWYEIYSFPANQLKSESYLANQQPQPIEVYE